jgi:Zn-dependent peptidase ImmA (M78 family)/transcriptional regulator with XRE-family HTH domain
MVPEGHRRAHGQRLTALRHIYGLTQTALADRLRVTQSFLSKVERGSRPVPDSLVVHASGEFGLPISFFAVQPSPLEAGPVTFRKTSRASVRDEERVSELYNEAARLFRTVSKESGYIAADLPDPADYRHDPEEVAIAMRQAAGLGEADPIPNATRCLERLGIGVVDHLDERCHDGGHTGVSRPSRLNDRPLVALADDVPGAVKRLTLLHEAYHLIGDRDLAGPITSTRSPEERRAFHFAGAVLLPASVVRQRVSESLNLHGYLPIKADYGISVPAIIRRARDLGFISSERYRSLSIQLSSQGWRTNEPVEVADEKPLLLSQALRKVYGNQAVARASHDVGAAPEWIRRWTHSIVESTAPRVGNVIHLASARARDRRAFRGSGYAG